MIAAESPRIIRHFVTFHRVILPSRAAIPCDKLLIGEQSASIAVKIDNVATDDGAIDAARQNSIGPPRTTLRSMLRKIGHTAAIG
jgi:hypothetical protein